MCLQPTGDIGGDGDGVCVRVCVSAVEFYHFIFGSSSLRFVFIFRRQTQ